MFENWFREAVERNWFFDIYQTLFLNNWLFWIIQSLTSGYLKVQKLFLSIKARIIPNKEAKNTMVLFHWIGENLCEKFLYPTGVDWTNATTSPVIISFEPSTNFTIIATKPGATIVKNGNEIDHTKFFEEVHLVDYRFLSIHYLDGDKEIEILLDNSYYLEGNELLSDLFVANYLKERFNQGYHLTIMDHNVETVEINQDQWIKLGPDTYTIHTKVETDRNTI